MDDVLTVSWPATGDVTETLKIPLEKVVAAILR